ncbi:MAG: type II toxin-antitoxin system HicA family toxin [Lachnoclostridium sp.]|jgi:predicted RNA binding protein YcfA (HicA-like mRNA interferase family)|nr:type II toxin-antitoxin system HicA family toxin [Lachnoclostridium sp.]
MKSYSSRELIKIVKTDGWEVVRIEGSHHIFKHKDKKGIITIPHPKKDLPEKTVRSIFTQAGLSIQ